MPNTREKLIEVLCSVKYGNGSLIGNNFQKGFIEKIVDHLIANGVTVQQWIPVTEPPKENGYYLCVLCVSAVNQRKEYRRVILFWEDNVWIDMANSFRTRKPLYWMPLPEPPKGE